MTNKVCTPAVTPNKSWLDSFPSLYDNRRSSLVILNFNVQYQSLLLLHLLVLLSTYVLLLCTACTVVYSYLVRHRRCLPARKIKVHHSSVYGEQLFWEPSRIDEPLAPLSHLHSNKSREKILLVQTFPMELRNLRWFIYLTYCNNSIRNDFIDLENPS